MWLLGEDEWSDQLACGGSPSRRLSGVGRSQSNGLERLKQRMLVTDCYFVINLPSVTWLLIVCGCNFPSLAMQYGQYSLTLTVPPLIQRALSSVSSFQTWSQQLSELCLHQYQKAWRAWLETKQRETSCALFDDDRYSADGICSVPEEDGKLRRDKQSALHIKETGLKRQVRNNRMI